MATDDVNMIELMDDEGNKLSFEHLLTFEVENDFFIAITPPQDMEDFKEGEVLIMRVGDDGADGEVYMPIESDEELQSLWEIFKQLYYAEDEDDCACEDCAEDGEKQ
jgi:uncharacterized protein YrzB (UPF0473 family)